MAYMRVISLLKDACCWKLGTGNDSFARTGHVINKQTNKQTRQFLLGLQVQWPVVSFVFETIPHKALVTFVKQTGLFNAIEHLIHLICHQVGKVSLR
jgi:hypothetical protein